MLSEKPTPEQLEALINKAVASDKRGGWKTIAELTAKLAFQAGQAAVLAKLREGGVELPNWARMDDLGGLVPSEIRTSIRDYGDRRSAAARVQAIQDCDDAIFDLSTEAERADYLSAVRNMLEAAPKETTK